MVRTSFLFSVWLFLLAALFAACAKVPSNPINPQQASKMSVPKLKISTKFKLSWSDQFPEVLHTEMPDEGASRFELPGPSLIFYRVGMKIFNGSGGVLGLYQLENGAMQVWNLTASQTLVGEFDAGKCAQASLSENGKIFIGGTKGLFGLDDAGKESQLRSEAVFLLATTKGNDLWVNAKSGNGLDLMDHDGKVQQTFDIKQPRKIVLSGEGEVCFYGKKPPSGFKALNESGKIVALTQYQVGPFDEIYGFRAGQLMRSASGGIQFESPSSKSETLPLISAGLDGAGKAFISGYDAEIGKVYLDRQDVDATWLEIPAKMANGPRPFYVVAIEDADIWVKGDSHLLKFSANGEVLETIALTNENLREELISRAWRLEQILGNSGTHGLISCVGPSGNALIEFQLE